MIIKHNLPALNTNNKLKNNNKALSKTLEKLASGFQINRAADDAAGLSISEHMRAQIRGLNQASENIQDGISLVNVADAGLANIQDPHLIRIRELAIQAANDTNTDEDRQKIQLEVQQLVKSIDNITNNTEFNTIKLLNVPKVEYTAVKEIEVTVQPGQQVIAGYIEITDADLAKNPMDPMTITAFFGTISGWDWPDLNIISPNGEEFGYKKQFLSSGNNISNNTNTSSSEASYNGYKASNETFTFINPIKGKWTLRIHHDKGKASSTFKVSSNYNINQSNKITATEKYPDLILQVGANENQNLGIHLTDARSSVLGIDKLDLSTRIGAETAIGTIDDVMEYLSSERSKYGSYMNALEHAFNNVSNTAENLTKAESILRDADMAKEMMQLTKSQILLQTSQSLLAQANQQPQNIIKLLQ